MANQNFIRAKAIEKKNKDRLLTVCPTLDEESGIYFLTRADEKGIRYFYIGQAKHILTRLAQHLAGYQHIDISLKKRGFFSESNPHGWRINFLHYPTSALDDMEQKWILEYTKNGYQCRYNKTSGGQGEGKEKINEFKPSKGYRDGLKQGYKNASREISHLFEKHLNVSIKSEKSNKIQENALEKFHAFLNSYKEEAGEMNGKGRP